MLRFLNSVSIRERLLDMNSKYRLEKFNCARIFLGMAGKTQIIQS